MATKTLKQRRQELGLTQTELAERSGVAQTYISDLETGARGNPTVAILRKLEKALRCQLVFSGHSSRSAA